MPTRRKEKARAQYVLGAYGCVKYGAGSRLRKLRTAKATKLRIGLSTVLSTYQLVNFF